SEGWLLCVGKPGPRATVGSLPRVPRDLYRSRDGGRSWSRAGARGLRRDGLPLGVAGQAGAGRLWEELGTLYLTVDDGRRWKPLPSVVRPRRDTAYSVAVGSRRAFALLFSRVGGRPTLRLVSTTRGPRAWQTVRAWRLHF